MSEAGKLLASDDELGTDLLQGLGHEVSRADIEPAARGTVK